MSSRPLPLLVALALSAAGCVTSSPSSPEATAEAEACAPTPCAEGLRPLAGGCGCAPALEGLFIGPPALRLSPGEQATVELEAAWSDGAPRAAPPGARWWSDAPEVAQVGAGGEVVGVAPGEATVFVRRGQAWASAQVQVGPPAELRGLWVSRWSWRSQADIEALVARAAAAGFNALFFQVRGQADAYYRSSLEPWAARLAGRLGRDPGWDPLQVALDAAHAHGLQLHAWVNTFTAWSGRSPPPRTSPRHILEAHPGWVMVREGGGPMQVGEPGYVCVSPGVPAVRDHLAAVFEEIVTRYPVDGLHLDYVRYYGRDFSHDPESRRRFAAARRAQPGLSWAGWQAEQITALVRETRRRIEGAARATGREARPILSAAVWHNYDLSVPGTAGLRHYYQASRGWAAEGLVDALAPMLYLHADSDPAFEPLARDHLSHAGRAQVYLGVHAFGREGDQDRSGASMLANLSSARALGAPGVIVFAEQLLEDAGLWEAMAEGPFRVPAPAPPLPPLEAPALAAGALEAVGAPLAPGIAGPDPLAARGDGHALGVAPGAGAVLQAVAEGL